TATGMAVLWYIGARVTTEIQHGGEATTVPLLPPMAHMGPRGLGPHTIRVLGRMPVARLSRRLTARKGLVKRIIRIPEPMARRIKPPTRMVSTEARLSQR